MAEDVQSLAVAIGIQLCQGFLTRLGWNGGHCIATQHVVSEGTLNGAEVARVPPLASDAASMRAG
jgi:hypothetical protein